MVESIGVAIAGAAGRMGQMLVRQVMDTENIDLVAVNECDDHHDLGRDIGSVIGRESFGVELSGGQACLLTADVVIDFTSPGQTCDLVLAAAEVGTALVIGTTGFSDQQRIILDQGSRRSPMVVAANMSMGINFMQALLRQAAQLLPESFDIEIAEFHHRDKRDIPSGTAFSLAQTVAQARGLDPQTALLARPGQGLQRKAGPRQGGQIGFAAMRGGSVIGDHSVVFAGPGERIEISHKADDRTIYAIGALKAAQWLAGQPAGLYTMDDVLGL